MRPLRSPAVATFLSFLWPGLGQWYTGRRRSAAMYAIPVLGVFLLFVLKLVGGLTAFGLELIDPSFSLTVLVLIGLLATWRLLSMVDALGMTGGIGTVSAVDADGVYNGELAGPFVYGPGKVTAMRFASGIVSPPIICLKSRERIEASHFATNGIKPYPWALFCWNTSVRDDRPAHADARSRRASLR